MDDNETNFRIAALKELYDQGDFQGAFIGSDRMIKEHKSKPFLDEKQYNDLLAIRAWSQYRHQQYAGSMQDGKELEERGDKRGIEIQAHSALQLKDYAAMRRTWNYVGDNSAIRNSLMAWFGLDSTPEEEAPFDEGVRLAYSFRGDSIADINGRNNGGKFFLRKGKTRIDKFKTLGLFFEAELLYGTESNWHHRAALAYWISKTFEDLGERGLAKDYAQAAVDLWDIAISKDPTNKEMPQKRANAQSRLKELQTLSGQSYCGI